MEAVEQWTHITFPAVVRVTVSLVQNTLGRCWVTGSCSSDVISWCFCPQRQQQPATSEPQAGAQGEGDEDANGRGTRQPAEPERPGRHVFNHKGKKKKKSFQVLRSSWLDSWFNISLLWTLQLTQRLKTAKRQMDEAEEEIERLEHAKKKLQRELDEQIEANEQLHGQLGTLRNEMRWPLTFCHWVSVFYVQCYIKSCCCLFFA